MSATRVPVTFAVKGGARGGHAAHGGHGAHAAHGGHAAPGGHGGHGSHGGHGGHGGAAPSNYSALGIGIVLNSVFVAVEVVLGARYQSTALLADAAHNFGDVLSLVLAWAAASLARRVPSERRTYGLRRATVLAALVNATLLLVTVGGISWEAVSRLGSQTPINAQGVMSVAALGVLVNGFSALLLARGQHSDVNMRAAFLHMVADAAISLGVVVAGWLVLRTGILWIDSAACLMIALVIGLGSWSVLREAVDLALDAVPAHVDPAAVRAYLTELPGVLELHDLHIWSMSTTEHALTAHLVIHWCDAPPAFMAELDAELEQRFGIQHATVQLESKAGTAACRGTVPGAL